MRSIRYYLIVNRNDARKREYTLRRLHLQGRPRLAHALLAPKTILVNWPWCDNCACSLTTWASQKLPALLVGRLQRQRDV